MQNNTTELLHISSLSCIVSQNKTTTNRKNIPENVVVSHYCVYYKAFFSILLLLFREQHGKIFSEPMF